MAKDLKGNVEKVCVMHEKLKEDSTHTELMCEVLVESMKDNRFRTIHNSQDECYLEVEDVKKNVEK